MVRSLGSICSFASAALLLVAAIGCEKAADSKAGLPQTVTPTSSSSLETVNIPHTSVKWQSIGNCWAYAALGWAESMIIRAPNLASPNFSETYVTYRHYELQLRDPYMQELQTGGSFQEAAEIINRYGLVNEGDFIPGEANLSKSDRQKTATNYLNESLKTGPLSTSRSLDVIRSELDAAFGVNLEKIEDKIISASSLKVGVGRGETAPLDEVMNSWREISWPISYNEYPYDGGEEPKPRWSGKLTEPQVRVMRRVMRAMNAKYPVVVNWFVDFRAMNQDGVFDLETLQQNKGTIRQGYHSTVLEDYIAEGIDPETRLPFVTPEGEASDKIKSLAVQNGTIKSLIVKNSWGGSERLDRPSYARDGERGYHKLGVDYLLAFLPRFNDDSLEFEGYTTGVNSFIVPPGF
ncbi:MAG: hypothetical protein RI953_2567 [Pseudomonadota bacterium]|jgi:hypothetical protein